MGCFRSFYVLGFGGFRCLNYDIVKRFEFRDLFLLFFGSVGLSKVFIFRLLFFV